MLGDEEGPILRTPARNSQILDNHAPAGHMNAESSHGDLPLDTTGTLSLGQLPQTRTEIDRERADDCGCQDGRRDGKTEPDVPMTTMTADARLIASWNPSWSPFR